MLVDALLGRTCDGGRIGQPCSMLEVEGSAATMYSEPVDGEGSVVRVWLQEELTKVGRTVTRV